MRHGNGACHPGDAGFPSENWFFYDKSPCHGGTPRAQVCHVLAVPRLIQDVLPAVMPDVPAVPEFLPRRRAAGAAVPASGGPASGGARGAGRGSSGPAAAARAPGRGELVREAVPCRWDDEEITRLHGFLATVDDLRGRQGRVYPLEYLLALRWPRAWPGTAGWTRPRNGPRQRRESSCSGWARRWAGTGSHAARTPAPSAADSPAATGAVRRRAVRMAGCRARALRPGMRRHLRIDGKALRGAAPRGGHAPMLLSGIWDDGTTAASCRWTP